GIRDKLVTGVQTCALPIFERADRPEWNVDHELAGRRARIRVALDDDLPRREQRHVVPGLVEEGDAAADERQRHLAGAQRAGVERSEERRVGKESGRGRWAW